MRNMGGYGTSRVGIMVARFFGLSRSRRAGRRCVCDLRGSGRALPLPAPAKQPHYTETGGEERKGGGKRSSCAGVTTVPTDDLARVIDAPQFGVKTARNQEDRLGDPSVQKAVL